MHCYHAVLHCYHAVLHCRVLDFLCYLSPRADCFRELPVARYRVDWHRGYRFRGWGGWAFRGCHVDCGYRGRGFVRGRVCSLWVGYLHLFTLRNRRPRPLGQGGGSFLAVMNEVRLDFF